MKLSLLVLSEGTTRGRRIPITLAQFLIGRDAQCHMRPTSPLISKRHCALLLKGGQAFVRDLDSTNGTLVNGESVQGECQLRDQDTLTVGPLSFQVLLETSPPVNRPTPPPGPLEAALGDDESAAALLLALQDEVSASPSGPTHPGNDGRASTTVAQEILPSAGQDKEDKKTVAHKSSGNTSQAAAAILEKYLRRKRE